MYPRGVKMNMKKIVVAGGGVLGSQIALQSAFCGFDVTIWLRSEGSIERAQPKLLRLKEIYLNTLEAMKTNPAAYCRGFSCESELSADKINELKQKVEDAYDSITLTTSYEEAGNDADLIIEAIAEDPKQKIAFYQELAKHIPEKQLLQQIPLQCSQVHLPNTQDVLKSTLHSILQMKSGETILQKLWAILILVKNITMQYANLLKTLI